MKKYLLLSTPRKHLKEAIRRAKATYGTPSWDNIPYTAQTWPQWITKSRESAIKDAREQNRKFLETYRNEPNLMNIAFFIELKEYD